MVNLNKFSENITTECSLIGNPTISISAIKIDGEGKDSLKYQLCQNFLKSCDYIKFTNNEICFIELSDFYEQLDLLNVRYTTISGSISEIEQEVLLKSKIIMKPQDVIKSEIISKISETMFLFDLIVDNYSVEEHVEKNKEFLICFCKIISHHSILFDRILRTLQDKFKNLEIDMFEYTRLEMYLRERL